MTSTLSNKIQSLYEDAENALKRYERITLTNKARAEEAAIIARERKDDRRYVASMVLSVAGIVLGVFGLAASIYGIILTIKASA